MGTDSSKDTDYTLDMAEGEGKDEHYVLCLYVAGHTPRSVMAISNIRRICDNELNGRCTLEIVDIYQEPERTRGDQLLAVPTLIKRLPAPLRRIIGDLSDTDKVLVGLDLQRTDPQG